MAWSDAEDPQHFCTLALAIESCRKCTSPEVHLSSLVMRHAGFSNVKAQEFDWTWHAAAIQPLLLPVMAFARPLCIGVATV